MLPKNVQDVVLHETNSVVYLVECGGWSLKIVNIQNVTSLLLGSWANRIMRKKIPKFRVNIGLAD